MSGMCESGGKAMKTVRLALVGLGNHMFLRLYPLLGDAPVELVAVCDRDEQRIERFIRRFAAQSSFTDYEEMLERVRPDAVLCAGNAQLHYEVAKACMLRGISPFVEKTPCVSLQQAEELAQLEHQTGCFVMAGFNRRYTTSYQVGREMLRQKEFGTPTLYLAKYNSSPYPSEDYFVFNHLIHHLDLARWLLGEIRDIRADKQAWDQNRVAYQVSFVTEKGTMGMIQSASLQHESYPVERVEVTGERGQTLCIDNIGQVKLLRPVLHADQMQGELILPGEKAMGWERNQGHSSLYGHYGFERELACYLSCIQNGTRPEEDFGTVVGTMALYEKLLEHTTDVGPKRGGGKG